nr:PREDICTED: telomeric repeat-binding factor 2-interacting protein 1 [Paralichthys olivaceus]
MTMPSKQQDVAKSNISPTLFLTVDGEPMSFFLRPGPVKHKLQPLITSGGGMMCSVQQPGAILLIDQDERDSIPETAAHWYVSINYIYDCIKQGKHLNVEDYRLNPEDIPRQSARLLSKEGSSGLTGGRAPYTPEEDAAILSYVSKHRSETGGNRLWQEMQKQHVTSHSWQSMKYRYRVQLSKKLSDAEEVGTKEENQETEVPKSSHSPQPEALQTDLTQIDDQPVPAASSHVEAETSNVSQPEEPLVDPQEDAPIPADSTEPEAEETQATMFPQNENVPEDSLQPPFSSFTPQKQKEKQGASPKQEQQPEHQPMRRQLEASSSPEPYGKKLRWSYSAEKLTSSSQSAKKTKTAVKKHKSIDPPPSKRARGMSVTAESEELESVETVVSETPQPDEESNSLEKAEKKKERRKFGILELATKEFEDESESGPAVSGPAASDFGAFGPAATEAFHAASRAHLFIFDTESQEEDSHPLTCDNATALFNPQPLVNKDAAPSITQVQLEEDMQQLRALMKQTNQDLVDVTKALLRTSGDFSAALELLLNPYDINGSFWNRYDDGLLISADPVVRQQLQEKYGEKELAKRIVFLELEG